MGKNKIPKTGTVPQVGKQVRAAESANTDWSQFPISWHFRHIDNDGPFGWHVCDKATLIDTVMQRVRSFETMTWRELKNQSMLHTHPVHGLSQDAKQRLNAIGQDDVEHLISLRIEKKRRVWGIQDRLYFKVLWWDPEHQVYPMNIANN